MARRTLLITYIATYLIALGTIIRTLIRFRDERFWSIALLLGIFLVLLLLEPVLIRKNRGLTYIYLFVQTAITCAVAIISPEEDYWAALFFPLVVQVLHNFPQRSGFLITGLFTAVTSILLISGLGLEVGLPLILIYGVVYFLIATTIAIILELEKARDESQKQQAELQSAHQQLQIYTKHAEELAVLQERSRLARDLHDSVTQSIYSLTLLAEAVQRMIKIGDLQQASENQSRLAEIAQEALQEMRLLVYELRPSVLRSQGLIDAIKGRLESVERRAGIDARMLVDSEVDLPPDLEEELFHISMEALNNSLKHSKSSEVKFSLSVNDQNLILEIKDNGGGFDLEQARVKGGMGLTNLSERVENIGGELTIQSELNKGTTVRVIAPISSPHEKSGIDIKVPTDHQEVSP